jgi:hypothetical protein
MPIEELFTDDDLASLREEAESVMQDAITIEPFVSTDSYGMPTYGAPVEVAAMIESYNQMVRNADGQEQVASTKIHIMPGPIFDANARITLPDGSKPIIIRVDGLVEARHRIWVTIYT